MDSKTALSAMKLRLDMHRRIADLEKAYRDAKDPDFKRIWKNKSRQLLRKQARRMN